MALWKDQSGRESAASEPGVMKAPEKVATLTAVGDPAPRPAAVPQSRADAPRTESIISAGLTIEGKIEGAGHVRIAGNFKGDVHVQGNVTIEPGAKLTGGVQADTVVIGGELAGNINAAARVELLQTGVLIGDLKAGSLIVAAGSRMRGQAEFGWDEKSKH
ncbi:MAG TPA: polymer-forming cytoskeletal protein [Steroidobacteraceae bacterium]|jgi:cytoskeletal protein CcmA (bactofilin family)|nr:polymer-forming cytoskeletal protein [Steroidobacteraceae bacterium]